MEIVGNIERAAMKPKRSKQQKKQNKFQTEKSKTWLTCKQNPTKFSALTCIYLLTKLAAKSSHKQQHSHTKTGHLISSVALTEAKVLFRQRQLRSFQTSSNSKMFILSLSTIQIKLLARLLVLKTNVFCRSHAGQNVALPSRAFWITEKQTGQKIRYHLVAENIYTNQWRGHSKAIFFTLRFGNGLRRQNIKPKHISCKHNSFSFNEEPKEETPLLKFIGKTLNWRQKNQQILNILLLIEDPV